MSRLGQGGTGAGGAVPSLAPLAVLGESGEVLSGIEACAVLAAARQEASDELRANLTARRELAEKHAHSKGLDKEAEAAYRQLEAQQPVLCHRVRALSGALFLLECSEGAA